MEKRMTIETKKFGRIEIDDDTVIEFPSGLIGFENSHRFALIRNEDFDPFCWLISLDGEEFSIPILNPSLVNPNYASSLSDRLMNNDYRSNKTGNVFCVVNINGEHGKFTINLKSPIFIDFEERKGRQLVLDSDELKVDQPVW